MKVCIGRSSTGDGRTFVSERPPCVSQSHHVADVTLSLTSCGLASFLLGPLPGPFISCQFPASGMARKSASAPPAAAAGGKHTTVLIRFTTRLACRGDQMAFRDPRSASSAPPHPHTHGTPFPSQLCSLSLSPRPPVSLASSWTALVTGTYGLHLGRPACRTGVPGHLVGPWLADLIMSN